MEWEDEDFSEEWEWEWVEWDENDLLVPTEKWPYDLTWP